MYLPNVNTQKVKIGSHVGKQACLAEATTGKQQL